MSFCSIFFGNLLFSTLLRNLWASKIYRFIDIYPANSGHIYTKITCKNYRVIRTLRLATQHFRPREHEPDKEVAGYLSDPKTNPIAKSGTNGGTYDNDAKQSGRQPAKNSNIVKNGCE